MGGSARAGRLSEKDLPCSPDPSKLAEEPWRAAEPELFLVRVSVRVRG